MILNKKIRGFIAVLTLAVTSALPTQANAITNALYLTMDGSGSISSSEWALQVNGYVNALNDVLGGGTYYGDVAIGVSVFSSGVNEIFGIQAINNATDLAALTGAITGISQPGGWTAAGDAINAAATAIQANFANAKNRVIDVSTDGHSNTGADPVTAAINAQSNGIATNCIGIGAGANCGFATGFSVAVNDFAGFEKALISKLQKELKPTSEPAIAMLLAIGLIGFGAARRRKA